MDGFDKAAEHRIKELEDNNKIFRDEATLHRNEVHRLQRVLAEIAGIAKGVRRGNGHHDNMICQMRDKALCAIGRRPEP